MGRTRVELEDGRMVLVGYDRPFQTLYAMLYDPTNDGKRVADEPDKAVGYHPSERGTIPGEITEYVGEYPCNWQGFEQALQEWGLSGDEREMCGHAIARDPDADPDHLLSQLVGGGS